MKIIVIILILLVFLHFYYKTILNNKNIESFFSEIIANKGVLPENTIDSIPVNTKIQDRYKNMYYSEYSDKEYEDILIHLLTKPNINSNINNSDDFIKYIFDILNNSDQLNELQIVDKSIKRNNIELLFYRKDKYQGKHVRFIINNNWKIISIKVIGSVPQDQIALFPVFSADPSVTDNLIITNKFDDSIYTFLEKDDSLIDIVPTNEIIAFDNNKKKQILNNSKLFNDAEFNDKSNLIQETVVPGMSETAMYSQFNNLSM
jgi:hypothetical protein